MLFTYPLVCDYIQVRYGLSLPKPRICCSAGIGLGFVSPNGSLYPCDRIATEPYRHATIGGAQVRPLSLLEHSFDEAFNSDYFRNMFAFIARDETYRDYVPCLLLRLLPDAVLQSVPVVLARFESGHRLMPEGGAGAGKHLRR